MIETGRRLRALPVVATAARSGELSVQQVTAVADAAEADPAAEGRLVAAARGSTLRELREECARTKAAACADPEARRRRIHSRRHLRTWTDAEGAWHLGMVENPEVGARLMAALGPVRDELFRSARAEGRFESSEACAADALVGVVCGGRGKSSRGSVGGGGDGGGGGVASPRSKVIVRVDLSALLRGRVVTGEVCEIAGYGPVAVSAVRDIMDSDDPFLAAVVTKGEQVVGVAHLGRRPTARQQTALEWLYPTCAAEGCDAVAFLEFDHRVDWAASHVTVFDLLDRLCTHHHDLKSTCGWGLVEGRGKRSFVPPDDPRHPCRAHGPPPPREVAALV